MNSRLPLAATAAAGGGMLATAAFLRAAAALAQGGNAADIGENAFTIDGLTLSPVDTDGNPGYNDIVPLFGNAPLLQLGGGDLSLAGSQLGILSHPQDFEVSNGAGADLGQVETTPTDLNFLSIESAQFIVTSIDPAEGVDADQLPAEGTVYSFTNLGSGFENVYEATPAPPGNVGPAEIQDTLVTPFGNFDLSTPYDATKDLNPNIPLIGLDTSSGTGLLGPNAEVSPAAFTINGTTFDPGGDGFDKIPPLFGIAPLLEIGGGNLSNPVLGQIGFAYTDQLEAYNSDGTDLGQTTVGVNASNILGINSTQFTVLTDFPTSIPTSTSIGNALGGSSGISFGPDAPITESDLASALASSGLSFNGDITGQGVINALADTDIASDLGITPGEFFGGTFDPNDVANGITFTPTAIAAALNGIDTGLPAVGTVYSVTGMGSTGFENVYEATPNADGTAAASIQDTLVTPFGNFDLSTPYDAVKDLDPTDDFKGIDIGGTPAAGASANAFTIGGTTLDPGSDGFDPINQLFGIAPLLEIGGGHVFEPPVNIFNPGLDIFVAQQELEVFSGGSDVGSVNTAVNTANILGIEATQLNVIGAAPSSDIIQGAVGDSGDISFGPDAPITESDFASALASSGLTFNGDISAQDVINALGDTDIASDLGITPPLFGGDASFDPADVAAGITFNPSDAAAVLNGLDLSDLPDMGTVYSVIDIGGGFENVYEAIPNADGTAAASIQDTFVTPFGNIDLSTMFDAIANLMPGNAVDSVDVTSGGDLSDMAGDGGGAGSAASLGGFDLFDPSSWFG